MGGSDGRKQNVATLRTRFQKYAIYIQKKSIIWCGNQNDVRLF